MMVEVIRVQVVGSRGGPDDRLNFLAGLAPRM